MILQVELKHVLTLRVYDLPKSHEISIEDNLPKKLRLWGLISPSSFIQQTFMSSGLDLMSVEGLLESSRNRHTVSKQSAVWDATVMCTRSYASREVLRLSWGNRTQAGYIEVAIFFFKLLWLSPRNLAIAKIKLLRRYTSVFQIAQDSHREQDRTKQDHSRGGQAYNTNKKLQSTKGHSHRE